MAVDAAAPVVDALAGAVAAPLACLQHNLLHVTPAQPEFVHQARAALRRLRSVLRAMGGLREARAVRRPLRGLRQPMHELGGVLGAARDADVFLLESLPVLAATTGVSPSALAPLARRATRWREAAYAAHDTQLRQPVLAATLLRAERLVWTLSGPRGTAANRPARSAREVAAALAQAAHQRVARAARRLAREGPGARHALRIEVKRLRYLVDQWQGVWPAPRTPPYLAALEGLQDLLGTLNDVAVADALLARLRALAHLQTAWRTHAQALLVRDLPPLKDRLAVLLATPVPWSGPDPEG
jgi:CHAD domain-containing protein